MRATSKITTRGQTTIPSEVRDALGLEAGDIIHYVEIDGRFEIIARNKPASDLHGLLSSYALTDTDVRDYRSALDDAFSHDGASDEEGKAA